MGLWGIIFIALSEGVKDPPTVSVSEGRGGRPTHGECQYSVPGISDCKQGRGPGQQDVFITLFCGHNITSCFKLLTT